MEDNDLDLFLVFIFGVMFFVIVYVLFFFEVLKSLRVDVFGLFVVYVGEDEDGVLILLSVVVVV